MTLEPGTRLQAISPVTGSPGAPSGEVKGDERPPDSKPGDNVMKTTAKIALASAVLLIPAALFASRQAATCCQGGADGIVQRIARKLDLSPQQIQEIRAVFAAHKAELGAELAAVRTAREHQFDAIHAASFDEAAIRSAAAEVGQAEAALAVT